ncbi:MAG: hypothetical protein Q8L29_00300, partial [archaeon]|nr:hypothetical protein [archaeon]
TWLSNYTAFNQYWYNMSDGSYNASYDSWLANYTFYNKFWYNMTYSGSTYNETYNTWAYNQTTILNTTQFNQTSVGSNSWTISLTWLIDWIENHVFTLFHAVTGIFTNLHADNINATNINASAFYEGGQRLALNDSLNNYYPTTNPSNYLNGTINSGRLTLESGVAISQSNQVNKTTLYFTPYLGDRISLYNSQWKVYSFTELSTDLSILSSNNYDIFINDLGYLNLSLISWTNDTARSIDLIKQDGIYVKDGNASMKYLGTIRVVNGQSEDSTNRRFVWNYYNRVDRSLSISESATSWVNGTSSLFRQANGNSANQVQAVIGVIEDNVELRALQEARLC